VRKIFLDCGADRGESVKRFQDKYADAAEYEIYCFEPHEKSTKHFSGFGSNITVINKACWVHNGTVDFFPAGVSPAGSTLLKDKTTWKVSQTPITVPCIDLSGWITEHFTNEDHIILKMNIEGAEYEVLEDMLCEDVLAWINTLYVSFHFRKIPSITKKRHQRLIAAIKETGQIIHKWWE